MITLGISPAHDSSICLYEDGKISAFYKEERLTRRKRDDYPIKSISTLGSRYPNKNIDGFAYCSVANPEHFDFYKKSTSKYFKLNESVDFSNEHHLQHASLAFYNSGFKNAAVIIIDRNGSIFLDGSRESETIFYAEYPHSFTTIYKSYWVYDTKIYDLFNYFLDLDYEIDASSSLGIVKVYESATSLIRQNALENGKTMGLAAYGEEKDFPPLFYNNTNIPVDALFLHENFDGNRESAYKDLMNISTKNINKDNYKIYADYAFHVQKQTQDAVSFLIQKAVEKTGCNNVVISGGYALNVVANYFLIKNFPDLTFYFEPIADDTGNSIGGAMLLYRKMTGDENIYPASDTFIHGHEHNLNKIKGVNVSNDQVADILINGKSVAIFEGLAEGGPRALGHRSILFYPDHPNSKDIVNTIKKREWYRPFAACVLEEDAQKLFEMSGVKSSPHMTISFPAKNFTKNKFPGIVHVDGSCRIQTVSSENKTLYQLLNKIKEKTGFGILLNTSLNLAGQPLVETPDEAEDVLRSSDLDYVWFPKIKRIVE